MSRSSRIAAALAVAVLGGGGCATSLWGMGLPAELPHGASPTANGIVLHLGEPAWEEAAAGVTEALASAFPDGVVFDGEVALPTMKGPEVVLSWQGALLVPGQVSLAVDPLGIAFEAAASLEPVVVSISADGAPVCEVEVEVDGGLLAGRLALTRSKVGEVQASVLLEASSLDAEGLLLDLTGCPSPADDAQKYASASDVVLSALAEEAFAALAPELALAVPEGLGLDLGTGFALSFGDDGVGSGAVSVLVRASETESPKWWQYAGGNLVVPYSVSIEATPHPCTPPAEIPLATASPVPAIDAEAAVMVHQDVLRRAAVALYQAGALCLERPARDLAWPVGDLVDLWPELAVVDKGSALRLRVWPESEPQLAFGNAGDDVFVLLHTGLLTVELTGEVEGAVVRLATVKIALELGNHVAFLPGGASGGRIGLELKSVDVAASGAEAGLLPAPPEPVVLALVEPIALDLLEAGPLGVLPPLPTGPPDHVHVHGAYVVFSRE